MIEQVLATSPTLVILTLVILLEWLVPLPFKYSPARGFRILATSFIRKVANKGDAKQQLLAGCLSIITYLTLLLIILFALLFAMPMDIWTQGVLLYLALGYQSQANTSKQIEESLKAQQKQLARSLLKENTIYQTDKLSELGIKKLTMESLIGQFVSAWLMPIVLFLLFGGITALCYRMLLEAYFAWHPNLPKLKQFGQPVVWLKNAIEWLPSMLLAPVYSVLKSSPGWLRVSNKAKQQWPKEQSKELNLYWLAIVSCGCKIELAGPVMAAGEKIRRPRLNQGAPLGDNNIRQLLIWNNRFRFILVLFNITVISLLFGLTL